MTLATTETTFENSVNTQHTNTVPVTNDEFVYRPMPLCVPIAAVFSLLSLISFISIAGVLLGAVAFGMTLYAMRVTTKDREVYSGLWLATISLVLSMLGLFGGGGWNAYAYQVEVPPDHQRISFARDISAKGFALKQGKNTIADDVMALVGKDLFLKGYMYPQKKEHGITQFLLLKDTGECCFGGQPAQTDMILVNLKSEKGIDHIYGRTSVAGKFTLVNAQTEEGLQPVYAIEATLAEPSRSAF